MNTFASCFMFVRQTANQPEKSRGELSEDDGPWGIVESVYMVLCANPSGPLLSHSDMAGSSAPNYLSWVKYETYSCQVSARLSLAA